jgi:CRP-like cAMP-binding protein
MLIGIAVLVFAFVIVSDLRARLVSLSVRCFQAGEVIFSQGDAPDFMYVISEGDVEFVIEGDEGESPIAKLGPADYFGDLAILSGTPYPVTARAATDVKLMPIHRRDFQSLYSHLPKLREDVHKEQQRRREMLGDVLKQSGGE